MKQNVRFSSQQSQNNSPKKIAPTQSQKQFSIAEDEKAKLRYVQFSFFFILPMQLTFTIINFHQKIIIEGILDLFTLLLFLCGAYHLRFSKNVTIAYRIIIVAAIFIIFHNAFSQYRNIFNASFGMFALPIVIFYLVGIKEGALWLSMPILLQLFIAIFPGWFTNQSPYSGYALYMLGALAITTSFVGVSQWIRQRTWQTLTQVNQFLETATKQYQTISGLTPICSYCKRIRNDSGYWNNLETFLRNRTNAQVSSSICSKCSPKDSSVIQTPPLEVEPNQFTNLVNATNNIKRHFVFWGSTLGGITTLYFIVRYIDNGNTQAAIVASLAVVMMIICSILVWKKKHLQKVYYVMVGGLFIQVLSPLFEPNPEPLEMLWFFVLPITAHHLLGWKGGLVASILLSVWVGIFFFNVPITPPLNLTISFRAYFALSFFFVILLGTTMEHLREKYFTLARIRIDALKNTYEKIRTIKGIVPICASCNAIRNDNGFWTNIETFMLEHTDLLFSHSICDNCLHEVMPELYFEMVQNGEIPMNTMRIASAKSDFKK